MTWQFSGYKNSSLVLICFVSLNCVCLEYVSLGSFLKLEIGSDITQITLRSDFTLTNKRFICRLRMVTSVPHHS